MNNCITRNQLTLMSRMNNLWEQHVFWTRLLIISILSSLSDLQETQDRLLQNPVDFGVLYGKFYGAQIQKAVEDLIREHLVVGAQLITAYKNSNTSEINRLNTLWYQNADKIASAFASFNPYYKQEEVRKMFYTHLDLTKKEVALRLAGNYKEDVKNYDEIEKEALEMANYFSMGIVNQFKKFFTCKNN